jgi:hypothetical protein
MWAPSPSTNVIETIVTDNGIPPLSATNSFTVVLTNGNQPIIQSVQVSNTTATIVWRSVADRTYRVQRTDSLATPAWVSLSPDVTAGGSLTSTTDPAASSSTRFYRVVLLP